MSFRSLHTHNESNLCFYVRNHLFQRTTGLVFFLLLFVLQQLCRNRITLQIKAGKKYSLWRKLPTAVWRKLIWFHLRGIFSHCHGKKRYEQGRKWKVRKEKVSVSVSWLSFFPCSRFPVCSRVGVELSEESINLWPVCVGQKPCSRVFPLCCWHNSEQWTKARVGLSVGPAAHGISLQDKNFPFRSRIFQI